MLPSIDRFATLPSIRDRLKPFQVHLRGPDRDKNECLPASASRTSARGEVDPDTDVHATR
jgi:hypothetical protein